MAEYFKPCSVDGCNGNAHSSKRGSSGLCQKHYTRRRRHGDPATVKTRGTCSVHGCKFPHAAFGLCKKHHYRYVANGDPLIAKTVSGTGKCQRYIDEVAMQYEGDECLIWPFHRNRDGYASHVGLGDGGRTFATRFICERYNGPPPSSRHLAAHDCGKGHLGCVSKRHLYWATPKENAADRVRHGTNTKAGRRKNLFTPTPNATS